MLAGFFSNFSVDRRHTLGYNLAETHNETFFDSELNLMHITVAISWILFISLFPMAFFWLRRAWRIFKQHDYSEVALKRGEPPADAEKWAPYTGTVNLCAGLAAVWVLLGVPFWIATGIKLGPFENFSAWSSVIGVTLWMKIFADFIISRQAHPFVFGKKKKAAGEEKS